MQEVHFHCWWCGKVLSWDEPNVDISLIEEPIFCSPAHQDKAMPLLLLCHGFQTSKESLLNESRALLEEIKKEVKDDD